MRAALLLSAVLIIPAAASADPGNPPITAQTSSSGGPLDPSQKRVRLDTVDLSVEVFPASETIAGAATLSFTATERTDRIAIDLDTNYRVEAVSVGATTLPASAYANPEGRMMVRLPRAVAKGASFAVTIRYAGKPHVAVRPPWDGGWTWAKTPDGKPWVATSVQMEGCDLIWPCIDHPTYEPATMKIAITVPAGLKAPSNGVLKGVDTLADGRTTWRWEARDPTLYGVAINVGPYEEISGTYRSRFGNTIPMYFWHLPRSDDKPQKLFAEFAPTLDFFETMIGPYPFADQKLGVVETPHKGMEHQSINAYGNDYAKTVWGFDDLFQHEFAHEWFANQLTVPDWDDFWLHEGTGSYMQPLYVQWRQGDAGYIAHMLGSVARIYNRAPIVAGKPQSAEDVYNSEARRGSDIYVKGSWTLHTLRGLIGDKAFFDALRLAIYGRTDPKPGNFKPVYRTTPEFIGFVNQTSGGTYDWFFDVYLRSAALPRLIEQRKGGMLSLQWTTEGNKPFPMPIDVSVDGKVTRVAMTDGRGSIAVPDGAHVVIDPMSRVLRHTEAVSAFGDWSEARFKAQQDAAKAAEKAKAAQ
ncbi:M1 family metallopeptidase [Sphingomonas sp. BGYR3]|uniref:M1 family metallopeptidase n=1 Tax=Sphingomonas sp. BGYR3 TaxID=2975483 RepID=UPI0021A3C89C|nr:M1 family metallopeptidase [Sphingomonas sp. BGYR3]MDG5488189.1 M1 family metallopeptidase [Sphingomonas sp. BGYR3]